MFPFILFATPVRYDQGFQKVTSVLIFLWNEGKYGIENIDLVTPTEDQISVEFNSCIML